jgi:hypothetical protein
MSHQHITRGYVEKLQAMRDAYEDERGHDPAMDNLVKTHLIRLLMQSKDARTIQWCREQLERENVRLRTAERLIPSGILNARDDFYDPSPMRRPSANPALSELGVYDWRPRPHIGLHPYLYDIPHASARAFVNPFSNRPSALQEFVLHQINPDANITCNNCHQKGHRRAVCPNPAVPGRRGGKTRTNKHKKGKKSIRRGKH